MGIIVVDHANARIALLRKLFGQGISHTSRSHLFEQRAGQVLCRIHVNSFLIIEACHLYALVKLVAHFCAQSAVRAFVGIHVWTIETVPVEPYCYCIAVAHGCTHLATCTSAQGRFVCYVHWIWSVFCMLQEDWVPVRWHRVIYLSTISLKSISYLCAHVSMEKFCA